MFHNDKSINILCLLFGRVAQQQFDKESGSKCWPYNLPKETIMEEKSKDELKEFLSYTKALLDAMDTSRSFDTDNIWRYSAYKQFMRKYNQLVRAVNEVVATSTFVDVFDIERVPGSMDTTWPQQKEYFDMVYTSLSILKAFLENTLNLKMDEIVNLKNFFQANLRKAVFVSPEKELEVQNAVEQLLIGKGLTKGVDYDRETGRVKVSIKESVPDFIFPMLCLAVEIKLSKDKAKSSAIVDEINADITAYGKSYSRIIFVVYDLGSIRDELEFKKGLELPDRIDVIVVKH